jgi:hypothetical protein
MKKLMTIGLILFFFLASMLTRTISNVSAQEPWAEIHPSEGTIETSIFLQVRGLGVFLEGDNWGSIRHMELYLYWDNQPLILGLGDPAGPGGTQMHYFDVNFTGPNEHPYSDIGNHTIYIEIYEDWATYLCNFTLTFEITEYFPCDEWLALNATYTSLLNNYTALNASYQNLMAQYNTLSSSYNSLLNQYDSLLGNYDSLLSNYNSLSSTYDQLKTNYQSLNSTYFNLNTRYQNLSSIHTQLQIDYNGLTGSYNSLQSIHNTLTSNYAQLQGNYTLLVSSFSDLQTEYNNSSIDLTNYRDLTYALITTTLVFLATTIYFARRKTKLKT